LCQEESGLRGEASRGWRAGGLHFMSGLLSTETREERGRKDKEEQRSIVSLSEDAEKGLVLKHYPQGIELLL